MNKEAAVKILVGTVALVACGFTLRYAFPEIVKGTAEVVSAAIAAIALLFGAIIEHTSRQIRDEKNAIEQRDRDENFKIDQQERDQRLSQRQRQQENYKSMLNDIDKVIRDPKHVGDQFSKIYLESWVVGSPDVIQAARSFLEATQNTRVGALQNLLSAMRKDLGLPLATGTLYPGIFQKASEPEHLNFGDATASQPDSKALGAAH